MLFVGAVLSRSRSFVCHVAASIHSFPTPAIKSSFVYRSGGGRGTLQAVVSGSWHVIEHEQRLWDLGLASPPGGGSSRGAGSWHFVISLPWWALKRAAESTGGCGASQEWSARRVCVQSWIIRGLERCLMVIPITILAGNRNFLANKKASSSGLMDLKDGVAICGCDWQLYPLSCPIHSFPSPVWASH